MTKKTNKRMNRKMDRKTRRILALLCGVAMTFGATANFNPNAAFAGMPASFAQQGKVAQTTQTAQRQQKNEPVQTTQVAQKPQKNHTAQTTQTAQKRQKNEPAQTTQVAQKTQKNRTAQTTQTAQKQQKNEPAQTIQVAQKPQKNQTVRVTQTAQKAQTTQTAQKQQKNEPVQATQAAQTTRQTQKIQPVKEGKGKGKIVGALGNHDPIIISDPVTILILSDDAADYQYDVVALDPDADELTYTLAIGPDGATIDAETGAIEWTATEDDLGEHNFTILVEDGRGGSDKQSFVVNVVEPGDAEIAGTVYEDVNRNGRRDTTLVPGDNPLVVFVVDTSGSMELEYDGKAVGDLNDDGIDSRLDAVIYALEKYQDQLVSLGMGDNAELALINFSVTVNDNDLNPDASGVQTFATAAADEDGNGVADFIDAAHNLQRPDDGTNYKIALDRAKEIIEEKGETDRDTVVVFITDGMPNRDGDGSQQAQALRDMGVTVYGIGVGAGQEYSLAGLRKVDPNGFWLDDMDDLYDLFSGLSGKHVQYNEPGIEGVTAYVDLNNNGACDANEPSVVTDENGEYAIADLPEGEVVVRADVPENGVQSQPTNAEGYLANLDASQDPEEIDFGFYYPDEDENGVLTIFTTAPETASARAVYRYNVKTFNPNGSDVTYKLVAAPDGMVVHPERGTIAWRPTNADLGQHKVVVEARNADGEVDTQEFVVVVEANNSVPENNGTAIPFAN